MSNRILIVEDEPLIAFGIEQDLEDAGFVIVGVSETIDEALAAIDAQEFDAVSLDGNLFGKSAGPIADRLVERNIPYVVVTGYSSGQVGPWINNAPRINKPYDTTELVQTIKDLLKNNKTES